MHLLVGMEIWMQYVMKAVWRSFVKHIIFQIKDPTCYNIHLILTNRKNYFQNSFTLDTSLSDFREMTITVVKMQYKKFEAKIISYRNYKKFDNGKFRYDIKCISNQYFGNA